LNVLRRYGISQTSLTDQCIGSSPEVMQAPFLEYLPNMLL
jgi:hypothetical protein